MIEGATQNRTHSVDDQVTSISGQSLAYDLNGNLTEDHHGNEYAWDIDDRLKAKTDDGQNTGTADFLYDILGRRVGSHTSAGAKTAHIWWGDREIGDYDADSNTADHPDPLERFLQLPMHNDWIGRIDETAANPEIHTLHKNYLDHVYALSDEGGDIVEQIRYTAFGEAQFYTGTGIKEDDSPTGNVITWNCKRLDPTTGLLVYKYRHYISELGRFASRDPIGERGGVNLYAFVGNGTLNKWDWLGFAKVTIELNFVPLMDSDGQIEVPVSDPAFGSAVWGSYFSALNLNHFDISLPEPYDDITEIYQSAYWDMVLSEIKNDLDEEDCIEEVIIRAHGTNSNSGGFRLKKLEIEESSQSKFLKSLGYLMCEECRIDLKSCEACTDDNKDLLYFMALRSGASVRGWTEGYTVYPNGNQWEVDPDGSERKLVETGRAVPTDATMGRSEHKLREGRIKNYGTRNRPSSAQHSPRVQSLSNPGMSGRLSATH